MQKLTQFIVPSRRSEGLIEGRAYYSAEFIGYDEVDGTYCKYFTVKMTSSDDDSEPMIIHVWEDYKNKMLKQYKIGNTV